MEDDEILNVQGSDRDYRRLRDGAVAVEQKAHVTGEVIRERMVRKRLRKGGPEQERGRGDPERRTVRIRVWAREEESG